MFTMAVTASSLAVSLVLLLTGYAAFKIIHNIIFSPLSAIPGPWYAAASDVWLISHVIRLDQCKAVHSLFEKYGPVVRVGPNKVFFNDLNSTTDIYAVHKFDKSKYYKSFATNNNDHAMTILEHVPHSIRRKTFAPHYAVGNLTKFQAEMHEPALELVKNLRDIDGKASIDCLTLFRILMVDVLVSISYGHRLGAMKQWATENEHPLSTAISDFPKRGILRGVVPAWAWNLVCQIPITRWRQLCDSDKTVQEFVSRRVYQARVQMNSETPETVPLVHRLLNYRYSTGQMMQDNEIISEAMAHMIAGSDTTAISISYFLWELSRHADIAAKLQAEIDEAMHDSRVIPDISVLQTLPYLNAFIKEALRMYSAAPSALERVVPTSKAAVKGFNLLGFSIPPGTIIATQAWSMHRNPSVFPSPETFLPERWLEGDQQEYLEHLSQMHQNLIPFGLGPRICGGQNLAQSMLKVAITSIVRNFDVLSPPETNEKSMNIKDSFIIFPSAMECKLIFKPRSL